MKKIMVFVSIIIAMFLTGCESNTEWSEPEVTSLGPVVYSELETEEDTVIEDVYKIDGIEISGFEIITKISESAYTHIRWLVDEYGMDATDQYHLEFYEEDGTGTNKIEMIKIELYRIVDGRCTNIGCVKTHARGWANWNP